jgi:hypothetical protein
MPSELPRGVRVGYGLGSVATGAFGTVPGLMLLPYLTDTLGVAAGVAGVVVGFVALLILGGTAAAYLGTRRAPVGTVAAVAFLDRLSRPTPSPGSAVT